jgi:hypothetical protein
VAKLLEAEAIATDERGGSAARGVAKCSARLGHAPGGELRYGTSKARSGDRVKVVEVHNAVARNSVVCCGEKQLGDQTPAGPGESRYDD